MDNFLFDAVKQVLAVTLPVIVAIRFISIAVRTVVGR